MADRTQGWLLSPADRLEIGRWFADRAESVDRCRESAQGGLRVLAERGLLSKGIPKALGGDGGSLTEMAEVIATVAGSCLTSAFVLWCHRMFAEYVVASGNPFLIAEVLPQALRLERFGATGLANAMKHGASLEELRVVAQVRDGGYALSGSLPWVSNLVDDRFVVAIGARTGEATTLLAVPGDRPGVRRGRAMPLFGLEGTVSASLAFDDVYVDHRWVIAREGAAFLARVRPTFLVLQSTLAWGLAESALANARHHLAGPRAVLKESWEQLDRRLRGLVADLRALAEDGPGNPRAVYPALKVRKELTELAVQAVWLELETVGAAGYLAGSATARRLREAAFLPVQSPSLIQLRTELSREDAS